MSMRNPVAMALRGNAATHAAQARYFFRQARWLAKNSSDIADRHAKLNAARAHRIAARLLRAEAKRIEVRR